jgi:hypothetical protein
VDGDDMSTHQLLLVILILVALDLLIDLLWRR